MVDPMVIKGMAMIDDKSVFVCKLYMYFMQLLTEMPAYIVVIRNLHHYIGIYQHQIMNCVQIIHDILRIKGTDLVLYMFLKKSYFLGTKYMLYGPTIL